jgi:hypothetical protein
VLRAVDAFISYSLVVLRVSTSLEKFFCGESQTFRFVFCAQFPVLYDLSGSVYLCSCVTFYVGMRGI